MVIGPSDIPVPTHFFQVVAPSPNKENTEVYIVPNRKIAEDTPLSSFRLSLKEFEKKTGIVGVESVANPLYKPIVGPL